MLGCVAESHARNGWDVDALLNYPTMQGLLAASVPLVASSFLQLFDRVRRRTIGMLLAMEALLAILHIAFTWPGPDTYPARLVEWFHVDREGNFPSWFSASQLVLLALVFAGIAIMDAHQRRRAALIGFWWLCVAGALFLSADEAIGVHESIGTLLEERFEGAEHGSLLGELSRFPSYYWMLIYIPIAVPVLLVVVHVLWRELHGSRTIALLGIVSYVTGAVVLDYLEGRYGTSDHQPIPLRFVGHSLAIDVFLVEELMEMVAVTLIIAALLRRVSRSLHDDI